MKVQFGRCTSNKISNVPIVDGQILFVKDTGEQYIDVDSSRNKITDLVFVPTLEARDEITNPSSSKLYYIVRENSIQFYCSGQWQAINYVDMENILTKDNTTPYTPTSDYNPATKKYVDDSIRQETEKIIAITFQSTDWVLNGQEYTLTITQAQHLLSKPYVVSVDMKVENNYKSVSMYGSELLPNGNLLIISDTQYAGRILLRGGI